MGGWFHRNMHLVEYAEKSAHYCELQGIQKVCSVAKVVQGLFAAR
jgi:hypothetical protein